jgi:hypothetical protein
MYTSINSTNFFIDIRSGTVFNGTSDNNICFGVTWSGSPSIFDGMTLASWRSSTGNDLNSSIANPLLASTDYNNINFCRPQTGSPVINAGEFTPNALDYYGNLRDSYRDIGACEFF